MLPELRSFVFSGMTVSLISDTEKAASLFNVHTGSEEGLYRPVHDVPDTHIQRSCTLSLTMHRITSHFRSLCNWPEAGCDEIDRLKALGSISNPRNA
jgi:hypothetical protein